MNQHRFIIAVLPALALAVLAVGACSAAEEPLRFVHLLQENGYGDVAADYLQMLAARPDLPAALREVWDLEMAKSLMSAAGDAFDDREKQQLLRKSQEHLAKFIKEKPDHPAAATAAFAWGEFLVKQAEDLLRQAKAAADSKQQEEYLAGARAYLEQAREKFQQAAAKFQSRLDEMPLLPKTSAKKGERDEVVQARIEAETNLQEARLQSAFVLYNLAQTYLDPKSDQRAEALKKAAQAFDDVVQRNRGSDVDSLKIIALKALAGHGRTAEEMGDHQLAMDIFDEVLVNAPDPSEKRSDSGLEPFFAQVEYFRLLILAQQKPQDFLAEAAAWLQHYRRLRQTDGYQAITLELAKATFALAESATGAEKSIRVSETLRLLTEMSKVRSAYQHEALLLRREVLKKSGRSDGEVSTFDEAVALGEAAAADGQWERARTVYNKALEIAETTKRDDPAGIAAVHEALSGIRLLIAGDLFRKGKYNECIEMAGGIVFDDSRNKAVKHGSPAAAQASALAVAAALNLYAQSPDDKKPAALEKLTKLAEFTEKNWPDSPAADDARIARGQAKLVIGQPREAIAVLERVNPKSSRYGAALGLAGEDYWRLYLQEKLKPAAKRDAKQMAADRAKAVERLTAGLEILKKEADSGGLLKSYIGAQLLLAEIRYEGGDVEGAAALYQPLVDLVGAAKPQTLDDDTLRIFLGAVRAYCAAGQLDKAGRVGATLLDLGPDTPPVDAVLVDFARLLNEERKKAEAKVADLEITTKDAELKKAKDRLESIQNLLGKVLAKLASRREVSLAGMVFIGETFTAIGMAAEAGEQFQKIISRAETDPEFAKTAEKAATRVRAHLVDLLRKEGKFEESLRQVGVLLKDYPNSLELLMVKGKILQDWAEKEPARFGAAVAHWVALRTRLQTLRKKPPEYYEVMYNVAACLIREAETSDDKSIALDRAKKAEQVLKSALILSPKLNGPDTVARYKTLLDKAIAMQGRSKG